MVPPFNRKSLMQHPNISFITLSGFLATAALDSTPTFFPTIFLLATLLIYFRFFPFQPGAARNASVLCVSISVGQTVSRSAAAVEALSTPFLSFLCVFLILALVTLVGLGTIYLDVKLRMRTPSNWSHLVFFPTLWSTVWFAISCLSPVGHLFTWSPVEGTNLYNWMIPVVGSFGIDWVVAAWAVVCSQIVEGWYMGGEEDEEELLQEHDVAPGSHPTTRSANKATMLLMATLLVLAFPSTLINHLPQPVSSAQSTPIGVGCVLPSFERYKHHTPTFHDYLAESQRLAGTANILLWPEAAIQFGNESERDDTFKKIRTLVTGTFVGVSFEETFTVSKDGTGQSGGRRTGLAIISNTSVEPHLLYYKRSLVPIAESFSLSHHMEPPSMYTIELPKPRYMNKTAWAPAPNHTRPIPITASICLDFATTTPFSALDARPALILAPARTWQVSVGYAMWQQAKRRAEELGSIVLWCDGGKGGVSGVAGQGYDHIEQVGPGSWVKTVGLQYPFNDRRSPFAYLGGILLLLVWGLTFADMIDFQHPLVLLKQIARRRLPTQSDSERPTGHAVPEGDLLN